MLKLNFIEWYEVLINNKTRMRGKPIHLIEENKPNTNTTTYSIYIDGTVLEEKNDEIIKRKRIENYLNDERLLVEFSPIQVIKSGYLEVNEDTNALEVLYSILIDSCELEELYGLPEYYEKADIGMYSSTSVNGNTTKGPLAFHYNNVDVVLMCVDKFCKLNAKITENIGVPVPFVKRYTNDQHIKVLFQTNVFSGKLDKSFKDAIHCIDNMLSCYGVYKDEYIRRFYPLVTHKPFTIVGNP